MTLRDQYLVQTAALPNGAASTNTTGFDTKTNPTGQHLAEVEHQVSVPALNTTRLPDGQTVTVIIQGATDAAFTSPVTIATLGTLTGAGGAGASAADYRARVPRSSYRYQRARATKTGAADASGVSMTHTLLF